MYTTHDKAYINPKDNLIVIRVDVVLKCEDKIAISYQLFDRKGRLIESHIHVDTIVDGIYAGESSLYVY